MKAFCNQKAPPGGTVPPPDAGDDREIVSPPVVIGPLFSCAEGVEVRGARYGAEIELTVGGTTLPPVKVTMPSQTIVPTPPLVAGDNVTAVQILDGVPSDPSSPPVKVKDTLAAFPSGLPDPVIDPTLIHECGRVIAVRHVRGAQVTMQTNGGNDVTYTTGGDWTNLPPAIRPFGLGHRYVARQALCNLKSGPSNEEKAVAPPQPMPTPTIDPAAPLAGQVLVNVGNLAHGAQTVLSEGTAGDLAKFSTAVSWQSEVDVASALGRPLQPGDALTVVSTLCEDVKTTFPEARPCERLDAPTIAQPLVGATSVLVTSALPGAQILIYDAALKEIGDGTATDIGLTRELVLGDVLTVIQKLGRCSSGEAFQVAAACYSAETCG